MWKYITMRLLLNKTLESQFKDTSEKIIEKVINWAEGVVVMVPNFILAIVVLILFVLGAKLIRKLLKRTLKNFSSNTAVNKMIVSISGTLIIIVGMFTALSILNLDKTVTSLLAGVGIVGLALGFAFQTTASNFFSGVFLAVKSPINVGDIIEQSDSFGKVKRIGLHSTTINNFKGQDIIIPNRLIVESIYKHYTINNERRIDLKVGISYGDDLDKVKKVTTKAISNISYLLKHKPLEFFWEEFGDSSINFVVRYWIRYQKEPDFYQAMSDGIVNIKKAFAENDITITFPIRTLDFGIKGGEKLSEQLNEVKIFKQNN